MNHTLVKGHYKTLFTQLPEGKYHITQYQFLPEHLNWVPISGETMTEKEAMELMKKLAKQQYSTGG